MSEIQIKSQNRISKITSAELDGITFNNIPYASIEVSARMGLKNPIWADYSNPFAPAVNAVDIDWNQAQMGDNIVLNTTGDLLRYIKTNTEKANNCQSSVNEYKTAADKLISYNTSNIDAMKVKLASLQSWQDNYQPYNDEGVVQMIIDLSHKLQEFDTPENYWGMYDASYNNNYNELSYSYI